MSFFKEHIIETYTTVLVALLGIVGTLMITGVRSDVQNLECSVSSVTVGNAYNRIELSLLGKTVDDLKIDSDYLKTLSELEDDFERPLSACKRGSHQLKNVIALRAGLSEYANKDYAGAINEFDKLDQANSLTQYLLAASKFHLLDYNLSKPEIKNKLKIEIASHLQTSIRLASEMPVSAATFRTLTRLRCASLMVNRDSQSNIGAIECLNAIIKKGDDDHNTYYNLSALYSREKNFPKSVEYLKACLDKNGASYIGRHEIEADSDMSNLLKEKSISSDVQGLLDKFNK